MSYILEAIRRSDEERRKRLVPSVSTIHSASSPRARIGSRPALIMVFAAALMLAVATGIGARSWMETGTATEPWTQAPSESVAQAEPEDASPPTEGTGPLSPMTRLDAETDGAPPTPVTVSPPPRPLDPPDPTVARETAETPSPAAKAGPGEAGAPHKAQNTHKAEKKPDVDRPRTPYSAVGTVSPQHQPTILDRRVLPPPSDPADPADPAGAPPGVRSTPPPPAAEMVSAMALTELPDPMRRALPDIAITLHRYADRPAARMIRVNGRVGREGDAVAEDLSIAQITRTGVVFAIGGERFYMDAFQNWQANTGS